MGDRLTREESKARTRSRLVESATRVASTKGLERASIDEVAAGAGYTKGAFYANFASKEELFLAMLDERFEQRIAEAERAWSDDDSPPEQARHSAGDFARAVRADPEAARLFHEFFSYAIRDERFRHELITHFATLRERLGRIYQRRADEYGLEPDIPMDRIVRMVIAMSDGWKLWQLLEPDAVDERLLEEMMQAFTIGIGVMAAPAAEPGR